MHHDYIILALSKTVDFDPLHYTLPSGGQPFVELFATAHAFFTWALGFGYLMKTAEDLAKAIMIMQNAHGVTASNVQAAAKRLS